MRSDSEERLYLTAEEGHRLYDAAARMGLDQSGLASQLSAAGEDPARHLRDVLDGKKPLTPRYKERLAHALGRSIEEFHSIISGASQVESRFPSFETLTPTSAPAGWNANRYFSGYRPMWQDVAAGFDIERKAYTNSNGIRPTLFGLLNQRSALRALAVLGVAGTGKSSVLRRAAYDAAFRGHLVLLPKPGASASVESITQQLTEACTATSAGVLVVIDDMSHAAPEGSALQQVLAERPDLGLTLLFAEHPDQWHRLIPLFPTLVQDLTMSVRHIHRLTDHESETLVDRILEYERAGLLTQTCDLTREERLSLVLTVANRHFVVAMIEMRFGAQFAQIIKAEYERVPSDFGKQAYALVSYFDTLRLRVPLSLLMRVLNVRLATEVQSLLDDTDGLFDETFEGLSSRNPVIARVVASHVLRRPEARQTALINVFSGVDGAAASHIALLTEGFSRPGFYRRFVADLRRDPGLVSTMYDEILASPGVADVNLRKLVLVSRGLAQRALHDVGAAEADFKAAIALDDNFGFARRQLAWLRVYQSRWGEAAELARTTAELLPTDLRAQWDAARILEFNTVKWFLLAGEYWRRAADLSPDNEDIRRSFERYSAFLDDFESMRELERNDLIPRRIWNRLRPSFFFNKTRFGPKDQEVRRQATRKLEEMQRETTSPLAPDDLREVFSGVDVDKDRTFQGLYLANIARLEFLVWRRGDPSAASPTDIRATFERAISLSPLNSFTRCWFGTFLKDVEQDFNGALKEYDLALEYARKDDSIRDHPMFLNNKALLIIDEVVLRRRPARELEIARTWLRKALERIPEIAPEFTWPVVTLDYCETLIASYAEAGRETDVEGRGPIAY